MAYDKVIDSAQLDSDLQSVANAIRTKGGTSGQLVFPSGFNTAIGNIPTKQSVTWNQCPEAVKNYIDYVTYEPNDYTTSQIQNYAPTPAVPTTNTKPIGKTVDSVTYYNEVPNAYTPFSSTNTAGTLTPLDQLRWLNTATFNVRDLGGWSCDGGTVKYGMMFRGGEINSADRDILVNQCGVRAELNLRGKNEGQGYIPPTSSAFGEDILYFIPERFQWYSIADKEIWKSMLRFTFDCILHNQPVYFHCSAGADRTGTFACVIEALLGMSQSDIDKDYELTCFATGAGADEDARRRNEADWSGTNGLITQIKSVPLEGGLTNTFRNRAISFVLSLGFTADEINAFRVAMINGTPETITPTLDSFSVTKSGANITFDNNISSVDEFQGYKVNLSANSGYAISGVTVTMGGNTINAFNGEKVNLFRRVTNTLTNCTTNNSNSRCIDGQGYGAIITADSGYTLEGGTISITIGGVEMAQQYYSNGAITIPNVTGNVVINVTAVAQGPAYTNLADPTGDQWRAGCRINSSHSIVDSTPTQVTNAIPVAVGDIIRIKNCGSVSEYAAASFPSESATAGGNFAYNQAYDSVNDIATKEITVTDGNPYCRFTILTADIKGEIIITRNEPITD